MTKSLTESESPVESKGHAATDTKPSQRRIWIRIVPLVVVPFFLCCGGGLGASAWLSYEFGFYRSSNNIRITNSARRAALEALEENPGFFFYVEEYDHFAYRVRLVKKVSPYDKVVNLTERGVPLTIDSQFHNYFNLMKPTIVHDGGADKKTGYEVILRGLEASKY